jgi:hypothetical protein
MHHPSDTDLARSLRLVRAVNNLRAKNGGRDPLAQVEKLDDLARTEVCALQKAPKADSYSTITDLEPKGRKVGLRPKLLIGYLAVKGGSNPQKAFDAWVKGLDALRPAVLGKDFVRCGAAHWSECYALILATQ